MAAAVVSDAAELAALAAERNDRHRAAQFRKRSGGAFKEHRGRGSNPHSVWFGLAAAAKATYVCRAAGCQALVDAGRARAGAVTAQRASFANGDGCASKSCAKRQCAIDQPPSGSDSWPWRTRLTTAHGH